MKFLAKILLLFALSITVLSVYGQADSAAMRYVRIRDTYKARPSAYDTMANYFNRRKVNFMFDIGTGQDGGVFSGNGNNANLFGVLNTSYSVTYSPAYSFSSFYGFTEKSSVGLGLNYQSVDFTPQLTLPGYAHGSATEFTVAVNYLHCIRTWRYFYYGFGLGVMFVNTNLDTNTYRNKPATALPNPLSVVSELVGFRYPIEENLWMNAEAHFFGLMGTGGTVFNFSIGLDYNVDTRPLCHKPVKMDPYYSPQRVYNRQVRDSILRSNPRYKELHDSNGAYYNKHKLHFTIESGSGDLAGTLGLYLGNLSPEYNENQLPLFRVAVDYGIGLKSNLGISIFFQQVNYSKAVDSAYYTNGNITYWSISARYTHTLFASRYLYYGFEAGISSFGLNYNKSNTFNNPPIGVFLPISGTNGGFLLGVKTNLNKNINIHAEIVLDNPITYFSYGVTYTLSKPVRLRFW